MNEKIRRFNEWDWMGFADCEKFENGTDPWIFTAERNGVELTLIGDVNGVELSFCSGDIEEDGLFWYENFETKLSPTRALGILRRMIKTLNLDGDWYAPDISYALDHAFKGISKI